MIALRHLLCVVAAAVLGGCMPTAMDKALVEASGKGDVTAIKTLLDQGANPNATCLDDWTPLTRAADAGQLGAAKTLIARGADVNRKSGDLTPLFFAARHGHLEVARMLIEKGARLEVPSENRATFVGDLKANRRKKLLNLLHRELENQ